VTVSFARDRANLTALATEIGGTAGESADAAAVDLVVLSVPWGVIDEALAQAGSLAGRIVIDTTNQFGRGVAASLNGRTAARYNADRMPGRPTHPAPAGLLTGRVCLGAANRARGKGEHTAPRAWPAAGHVPPAAHRVPARRLHITRGSRGRARGPASAGSARG
jgi:hypothetical protein